MNDYIASVPYILFYYTNDIARSFSLYRIDYWEWLGNVGTFGGGKMKTSKVCVTHKTIANGIFYGKYF